MMNSRKKLKSIIKYVTIVYFINNILFFYDSLNFINIFEIVLEIEVLKACKPDYPLWLPFINFESSESIDSICFKSSIFICFVQTYLA